MSVVELLRDFERAGYEFVYSRRLIRRAMTIEQNVPSGKPLDRLAAALAAYRLHLEPGRRKGRWLIVANPPVRPAAEVPPSALENSGRPMIEELFVTSSRYALQSASNSSAPIHQLRDNELENLPEVGDDALRAALHLPGMATVGLSAQPHVRGGLKDETLILFDGVELLEPFHLKDFQSLFSGVNPSLVRSIDVYTGGFPARYGDRLSSVIDIQPQSNHSRRGGELNLSLLTAGISLYGPLGGAGSDWLISARRGNLDLITEWINPDVGRPRYSDLFAQFNTAPTPTSELSGALIYYDDDVRLQDGEIELDDGERAFSRYRNAYAWLKFANDWSETVSSVTAVAYGRIRHNRTGEVVDEDLDDSNAFTNDRRKFDVVSLQQRVTFASDRNKRYELGGRVNYQQGSYDYDARIRRGELAELIGNEPEIDRSLRLRPNGFSGGIYGSAAYPLTARIVAEAGLRWDYQDYAGFSDNQWSPRLSMRAEVGENTTVRLSAGRFHQPEAMHELQIVDGFDVYQKVQRADHYIVSLQQRFGSSPLRLRAELFHKRIRNPKRRFENLFDPLVLLPELAADRVPITAQKARSRGLEVTLGYRTPRSSIWLSYTRSRAEDYVNDRWVKRSWDQAHTLSTGAIVEWKAWTLSASALWHSGWPFTPLPGELNEGDTVLLARNTDRLANYLSIDTRLARHWQRGKHEFTLFAEVTNLLNRNNVGSVEVELEENDETGGFEASQLPVSVLPLVPSIGFTWRW